MANFKEDLKRGEAAERRFQQLHKLQLTKPSHLKWDFDGPDGERLELKADFYDPTRTPNLFLERWSDVDKKKPGGVWQSLENGANIFCYWFVNGGFWLECRDLPALVKFLDVHIESCPPFEVVNPAQQGSENGQHYAASSWTTVGYRIPRKILKGYFDIYVCGEGLGWTRKT